MKKGLITASLIGALILGGAGCSAAGGGAAGGGAAGGSASKTTSVKYILDGKEIASMELPANWKSEKTDDANKVTLEPISEMHSGSVFTDGTPENRIAISFIQKANTDIYNFNWKEALIKMYYFKNPENVKTFYEDATHKSPGYEYEGLSFGSPTYTEAFWGISYMAVINANAKNPVVEKVMNSMKVSQ